MSNSNLFLRAGGRHYGFIPLCIALALLIVACQGEESPFTVKDSPGDVAWTLRSEIGAVTVAIGGTQQLNTTPRKVDGTLATTAPPVTYVSDNPLVVQVSPSGLVTGLDATVTPANIIASVSADGVNSVRS